MRILSKRHCKTPDSPPDKKRQKIYPPNAAGHPSVPVDDLLATDGVDLPDGPPPGPQERIPTPAPFGPTCHDAPNNDLLQGGGGSTRMPQLPPIRRLFESPEDLGSSLSGLSNYSLAQPAHPPRLPSLSPISPKQSCQTDEPLAAWDQVPATAKPGVPPTSHPGEKLGIAPPPTSVPGASAVAPSRLTHRLHAPTKQQVAYDGASGLPAMARPACPTPLPALHALPPRPHTPSTPPWPLNQLQRHASKPMSGFNGFRPPPLTTPLDYVAIQSQPAGAPEMPEPAAAAPVSPGARTQHVRPDQETRFRPPPSLIQPTYRKPSPNLVVDVAEMCQERFPFLEVAERHRVSVEKVVDVFAAIIKVPLLRCPTDRRRAGKLATARMKEYGQARKSMMDNAGHSSVDLSPEAVAAHMGPANLPDNGS